MSWIPVSRCWLIFLLCVYPSFSSPQRIKVEKGLIDCQQRSTLGRTYRGEANTTVDGLPCQRWSDTEPHDHSFTDVGEHNFCRNPDGSGQVWCFTTDPEYERKNCSVPFCPSLKALDFSLDNDDEPDEENEYTHASLKRENLPLSFTICTAFMFQAWTGKVYSGLFTLTHDNGETWQWVAVYREDTYSDFQCSIEDSPRFEAKGELLLYPLQWTRVCYSIDSSTSIVRMVVDGEQMMEKYWKVKDHPLNLNLVLGKGGRDEYPAKITDLNIFSSALPVEQMKLQTSAGKDACGLAGDFLSWEKSLEEGQWALHSKARWVELDGGLESPCMAASKINIFPLIEGHRNSHCMELCQKLGGRSPPVKSTEEWEGLWKQIESLSPDLSRLPNYIWLSATEGDIGRKEESQLGDLEHWPEGVTAEERLWRDYYTGELLENFTKPWLNQNQDGKLGDNFNCIDFSPRLAKTKSWTEWSCYNSNIGCPCTFEISPLLNLRGVCPDTLIEHMTFTTKQTATNPRNIIIMGHRSGKIEYDSLHGQWVYLDPLINLTAKTRADQKSYALGKHTWTISGDTFECSQSKEYERELKLTGCQKHEFTCNDGQCIKMEERCDQTPQCRDESDEENCKTLLLQHGYNKEVPPTVVAGKKIREKKPFPVRVALTLQKVIDIGENDHSISLKFKISLMWCENRVTYQNLKIDSTRNLLRKNEVKKLWLPLVIYWNTDQEETTRLGKDWEWATEILVQREGTLTRSPLTELDEAEIFQGAENSLRMEQTYTRAFQCVFELSEYPFDTQVCHIEMVLGKTDANNVLLVADDLHMEQQANMNLFFITEYRLVNMTQSRAGVKMEIKFKRKMMSEMMTTYLPSFLLMMITFATTFFKPFFFEAALSVNLTTMLVMTTIFISKMEGLPPTSDIKMIDIWLVFCQLVPFTQVVLLTAMEYLREEKEEAVLEKNSVKDVQNRVNADQIDLGVVKIEIETEEGMGVKKDRVKSGIQIQKEMALRFSLQKNLVRIERKVMPLTVLAVFVTYSASAIAFYLD